MQRFQAIDLLIGVGNDDLAAMQDRHGVLDAEFDQCGVSFDAEFRF